MKVGWITFADAAVLANIFCLVFVEATTGPAHVCYISTEPNPANRGKTRFVLPSDDPCSCTEVRLGGHNTQPIPRANTTVYMDDLSTLGIDEIRNSLGCHQEPTVATGPENAQPPTTSEPQPTPQPPADCQDILDAGQTTSGVYTIEHAGQNMNVYCSMDMGNRKGYIVFQRRQDGTVSFDRTWQEYANGFGDLFGEFWLGNQRLRALTEPSLETWELLVTLTSFNNQEVHARYGDFSISGNSYDLSVDDYDVNGQAGDSLTNTHKRSFTTKDRDNDNSGGLNCANKFRGGWWYKKCNFLSSNLNGVYHGTPAVNPYMGIQWNTWTDNTYSLKSCEMKMRRGTVAASTL